MNRTITVAALFLGALFASAFAAEQPPVEFDGRYDWNVTGEKGELRVLFTAGEESDWEVVFEFDHFGTPHNYRGPASGSLIDGELIGEVNNEKGDRTFTFEGRMDQGAFRGTHHETTQGAARRGGTLTMTRSAPNPRASVLERLEDGTAIVVARPELGFRPDAASCAAPDGEIGPCPPIAVVQIEVDGRRCTIDAEQIESLDHRTDYRFLIGGLDDDPPACRIMEVRGKE